MINIISKTLEAQEKTQYIKQSPSTKIGIKPDTRSRRNELTEVTGRWRKATGRSDQEARQQQQPDAEWQIDRTQDSSVRSSTVWFQSGELATGRVRWQVTGRCQCPISCSRLQRLGQPDASDNDDSSVRSVAEKRNFVPNGYFLSGAYKYSPQPIK